MFTAGVCFATSAALITILISEKSIPPVNKPKGGNITSVTSELTILPKAAPITTPTARSMTLPFMANSLNSFTTDMVINVLCVDQNF